MSKKKTRRSKPYLVEFDGHCHEVNAAEFVLACKAGILNLTPTSDGQPSRKARVKVGFKPLLREGRLHLLPIGPWIKTSWLAINRRAGNISDETLKEFLETYSSQSTERYGEVTRQIIGWNGSLPA